MARLFAFALFLLAASRVSAQDLPKNGFYLELGGSGFFYTFNYERTLSENVLFGRINARVGFGTMAFLGDAASAPTSTLMMIHLLSNAKHGPDIGFGVLHLSELKDWKEDFLDLGPTFLPALAIGYRYQSLDNGAIFRFSFTPFLSPGLALPWIGISVGNAF